MQSRRADLHKLSSGEKTFLFIDLRGEHIAFIYKRNFRSNGFVDEDETLHIFWKLMLLVFPKTMRHSFAFSEQRRKKIVFMA